MLIQSRVLRSSTSDLGLLSTQSSSTNIAAHWHLHRSMGGLRDMSPLLFEVEGGGTAVAAPPPSGLATLPSVGAVP